MAKHFVAVETAPGLSDTGKMFAVDPSAASGIALPSFKMVSTLPRIGNIIGEGYFVTSSKTAFAWDGRVFQPVVPSAILTYPNDAAVYADNTQSAGSYGASADTGHLFIMSQTGWRMVGSKIYANIANANADTNVSDGALGWLTAEQVMIIRVAGAWQRIVDTPHVTVTATKPTSPITGDMVFNATTKVAEIYDGAAWSSFGGSVTVSETSPATATPGALWYRDSTGLICVWVNGGWHYTAARAWSAATAPTGDFSGQLWYNTSEKSLNVWDGATNTWKPVSGATPTTVPTSPKVGELYYSTTTKTLLAFNGTKWVEINQSAGGSVVSGQGSPSSVFNGPYPVDEAGVVNIVSGIFKHNTASGGMVQLVLNGMTAVPGTGNMIRHASGAPAQSESWNPFASKSLSGTTLKPDLSKWAMANSFLNQFIFFVDKRVGIDHWGWIARQPENGESCCIVQGIAPPTSIQLEGTSFVDARLLRTTAMHIPF